MRRDRQASLIKLYIHNNQRLCNSLSYKDKMLETVKSTSLAKISVLVDHKRVDHQNVLKGKN